MRKEETDGKKQTTQDTIKENTKRKLGERG